MSPSTPFNLKLMQVDEFIKKNNLMEVTSSFIHTPSSSSFEPNGLFSEEIFGQVASQNRLIKLGFIDLHCRVFHPIIFQNLVGMKRFYGEIMASKSYAKWDPMEKDFVHASSDEDGADTGFSFFLTYFDKIQFNKNNSLRRNDKISIIQNNKDRLFITKCIVSPAGIRDLKDEDSRMEKDSINSLYIGLLERAKAMPPKSDLDPIYDNIHYSIQRKVLEIYEYLLNFVKGKRGFFESRLGARSVAQGTRNVITSTSLEAESPESPQYHKLDEVKVPLYQATKGFASFVMYYLKSIFYSIIIQEGADNIALINPDTLHLEYVQISDKDKESLLTAEGINKTLDKFRDIEFRWRPVSAKANGKNYYLIMVYDEGKNVWLIRNVEEFKMLYKNKYGKDPDKDKFRTITYCEMIYVATYYASLNKFGTVTRYPVTDEQSIFVAKTHLMTTSPGRIVNFITNFETEAFVELPEYPILGNGFLDVMMFHPFRRSGLTADYDGDTVSWIPIMSEEANKECEDYVNSTNNYIFPNGASQIGTDDLIGITMNALTEDPPKEK